MGRILIVATCPIRPLYAAVRCTPQARAQSTGNSLSSWTVFPLAKVSVRGLQLGANKAGRQPPTPSPWVGCAGLLLPRAWHAQLCKHPKVRP